MVDLPKLNKAARKERFEGIGWWRWFLQRRSYLQGGMDKREADRMAMDDVERLHGEGKVPGEVDVVTLLAREPGDDGELPVVSVGSAGSGPVLNDRVCRDARALIWYLYESMDDPGATLERAPSKGAWYHLQALRNDLALRGEFYKNVWGKIAPRGVKESGEGDVPVDTSIVLVKDVYDTLGRAAESNTEGVGGESEVADGGVDEGGA